MDVIFEDDAGFWSALNQLIETSRKPVILTATYGIEQLKTLVKHMNTIRIDAPHYPLIEKQLLRLVHKELDNPNYRIQNDFKKDLLSNDDFVTKLQLIVKQCCQTNGDVRKSINLLQFEITAFLFGKLGLQDESNSKKLTTTNETGGDRSLNKLNLLDIERMSIADILGEQFSLNEMNDYDFTIRHEPNFSSKSLSTDIVNKLRVQKDSQIQIQEPGYLIEMKKQNHSESIQNVIDALSLWPNHGASLSLDYFPYLSFICLSERERYDLYSSNTRKSRRYMHYLDSVSILLSKECKAFFLHYLESPTVSCY